MELKKSERLCASVLETSLAAGNNQMDNDTTTTGDMRSARRTHRGLEYSIPTCFGEEPSLFAGCRGYYYRPAMHRGPTRARGRIEG